MRNNLIFSIILIIFLFNLWTLNSCKKGQAAELTDKELYEMSKEPGGFIWYKNSNLLLDKSSGSGHSEPLLKTRYNFIAATKLDSTGKIITGAVFPDGSLIVKELFSNATTLDRYAILYKKPGDPNADDKGWVWGYVNSKGKVVESVTKKGKSCVSCHSQIDNIDYMLMNKYFP